MIKFADAHTAPLVRQMWKICFGDSEKFMDIYFSRKYRNENTLVYFEEGIPVASLQMLPYTITFYGETIPFAYLAGLCTLPEHRKKGYMAQLIHQAHTIIMDRQIPLSILIPAEEWLYGFYEKYGYQQVFTKDDKLIPLKQILDRHPDMDKAYYAFDSLFRGCDFCVQKNRDDFEAIAEEYKIDNYPPKTNLSGMARIIDAWSLLKPYAAKNPKVKIRLGVKDDTTYLIKNGWVEAVDGLDADLEVDERMLCRLLFGYKTDELGEEYLSLFPVRHPVLNLMLE